MKAVLEPVVQMAAVTVEQAAGKVEPVVEPVAGIVGQEFVLDVLEQVQQAAAVVQAAEPVEKPAGAALAVPPDAAGYQEWPDHLNRLSANYHQNHSFVFSHPIQLKIILLHFQGLSNPRLIKRLRRTILTRMPFWSVDLV